VTLTLRSVGALNEPATSPVPEPGSTEEKILNAALGLIGRRGVRRLGMQEVSEAAGVSRGTLYRYFPSKDQLLAGAATYDERKFTDGLAAALAPVMEPRQRIGALVDFAFDYIRMHPARALFDSEPGFVLSYLLEHLPGLRAALLDHLGDDFDTDPGTAGGRDRPSIRFELDHPRVRRPHARAVAQQPSLRFSPVVHLSRGTWEQ
jgi:AcrR family transcriptional regulator